ncbi:hypothetical protein BG011_002181 [Mortierella polycephala]|uniref:F-box domain-containing protein n=1 Tax=Mortierella polycephala TaxID=41804 RepID=A0A9P6Q3R3_9FUNG|nr:hypothetical protein BG011_002181 [Mortierella polycephala]
MGYMELFSRMRCTPWGIMGVAQYLDKESSKVHSNYQNLEWEPEAAEAMYTDVRDFPMPGDVNSDLAMGVLMDSTPKHSISKIMLEENMFDTRVPRMSPLDLPELRLLIASYFVSDIKTLAACTRVCTTWHDSFNPFLWTSLALSRLLPSGRPSLSAIQKYACWIKHLRVGRMDRAQYPLERCTGLTTLCVEDERVSGWDQLGLGFGTGSCSFLETQARSNHKSKRGLWQDMLVQIIEQNPGLQRLSLMMEQFEPTNEVWRAIGSRKFVDGSNAAGAGQPRHLDCIFTRISQAQIESCLDAFALLETLVLQHCRFDLPTFSPSVFQGRVYSCLRSLTLITNTGLDFEPQLGLMACFPNLQSLTWSIAGFQHLPVQEFCDLLSTKCPLVESIVLSDRNLEAHHLAQILQAIPKLVRFFLGFDTLFSMFNSPAVMQAMRRHFKTLQEIEFGQIQSSVRYGIVLAFLTGCPNLQRMGAYGRLDCSREAILDMQTALIPGTLSVASAPETAPSGPSTGALNITAWDLPWVCLGLKRLHLILTGDHEDIWLNPSLQQSVFLQLGRLHELETLSLGHCVLWMYENGFSHHGLNFTLEAGLSKLSGLHKLEELNIEGIYQQMTERDVVWMLDHWPRLRVVEGELHHNQEEKEQLDVIMKKKGFKISSYLYRR